MTVPGNLAPQRIKIPVQRMLGSCVRASVRQAKFALHTAYYDNVSKPTLHHARKHSFCECHRGHEIDGHDSRVRLQCRVQNTGPRADACDHITFETTPSLPQHSKYFTLFAWKSTLGTRKDLMITEI